MATLVDHGSSVTCYGSSRSVVRMVATRLPIDTGERIYIQLPHIPGSYPPSPSCPHNGTFDLLSLLKDSSMFVGKKISLEPVEEENNESLPDMSQDSKAVTVERITSLEAELAKLKAKIATYALSEAEDMDSSGLYTTDKIIAPPPPPPPPLPSIPSTNLIHSNTGIAIATSTNHESTPVKPPLSSVLKDLGSVKLRTVGFERSPGGTPMRPKNSLQAVDLQSVDDPASIIAHALRKKFSHRIFQDSPDKENLDRSECSFNEFDSPVSAPISKKIQFESSSQSC